MWTSAAAGELPADRLADARARPGDEHLAGGRALALRPRTGFAAGRRPRQGTTARSRAWSKTRVRICAAAGMPAPIPSDPALPGEVADHPLTGRERGRRRPGPGRCSIASERRFAAGARTATIPITNGRAADGGRVEAPDDVEPAAAVRPRRVRRLDPDQAGSEPGRVADQRPLARRRIRRADRDLDRRRGRTTKRAKAGEDDACIGEAGESRQRRCSRR